MKATAVREVTVHRRAAVERIERGHPWVWREAIEGDLEAASPGEEVQLRGRDGALIARGLADPGSPIAVRVWTQGRAPVDRALWTARSHAAVSVRAALFDETTDAFRVLNGEGDRMPGFVVDRYGSVCVVRTDGEGAAARVGDLVEALWPALRRWNVHTVVHRTPRARRQEGQADDSGRVTLLRGDAMPDSVVVHEHGVPFVVDLRHGQKTGAFLDQRDNRRRVGELARGRRVLNLFSYAGGFSLHAALGGAAHVTSVDVAAAAHATAQASFRAAGVDPSKHAFVTADVRSFLDAARLRGQRWDLVVSDPPSFAPSEKAVPKALAAYRALHRACVEVLEPGGLFCAASCSSHVDASAFVATLDDAATGGRGLRVLEIRGPGPDHPSLPAFPEGRYLKFVLLAG